jgi:hypothetical protein
LLPCVDLLLVHEQKVEQLHGARGAQEILAVRRRDKELAATPSERNLIDIDTIDIDSYHAGTSVSLMKNACSCFEMSHLVAMLATALVYCYAFSLPEKDCMKG